MYRMYVELILLLLVCLISRILDKIYNKNLDELCKLGDLEKVKQKIGQEKFNLIFKPDHIRYDFNRGLVIACKHGHLKIAKLMIENGADRSIISNYLTSRFIMYTKLHEDLIRFVVSKF